MTIGYDTWLSEEDSPAGRGGYTVDEDASVYSGSDAGKYTNGVTFKLDLSDRAVKNYDLSGVAGYTTDACNAGTERK